MKLKESTARARVMELDLTLIKERVKKENPRWSKQKLDKFELAYRGFLFVCWKYPGGNAPTLEIDEFWHAHIMFTQKYMRDCRYIFGRYLHHTPFTIKPSTRFAYAANQ